MSDHPPNPQRLSSRIAFESRWLTLREDRLRHADGHENDYFYVERRTFAIIAAVQGGRIWMVEQYRPALRRRSLELPMGVAPGAPEEMAATELREETGLVAGRLTRIGELAPAPGVLDQTGVVFLAEELTPGPRAPEPGEQDMIVREMAVEAALAAAAQGEILCGVTLAALGLMRLTGRI